MGWCLLILIAGALGLAACGSAPVGQPSTTSTGTVSSVETTTSLIPSTTTAPLTTSTGPAVMPPAWAGLSTERTEVGLFDTATGEPRWTIEVSETSPLLGASLVRMGPDRQTYVETCCEPAAGKVVVVDGAGSAKDTSGGYFPAPSPDGHWLATTNGTVSLFMGDLGNSGGSFSLPGPSTLTNLSWSLDSVWLALNSHTSTEVPSLLILDPTAVSSVDEARVLFKGETVPATADASALSWYLPVFTDLGLLVAETEMHPIFDLLSTVGGVVIDPTTGVELSRLSYEEGVVVDQDSDLSGHYVIYVLTDGSVHWMSTSGEGGLLAKEGFRSASW